MTLRRTRATALRVLRQLRHDPRTIALLLAVPCVLQILVRALFAARPSVFQSLGVPLLGLLPFVAMFIVTSITMLRERVSGTLERLMTTPLARGDLLVGYALAFALVAAAQATLVSTLSFGLLGLDAGHGARPVCERVRAHRVPGCAVHARLRAAADPALRPHRSPRRDGGVAARDLRVHAADLRLRRARPARITGRAHGALLGRRGNRPRGDDRRARARSGDAPAPHAVTSQVDFTAEMSLRIDSFASPKSIVVFGSR